MTSSLGYTLDRAICHGFQTVLHWSASIVGVANGLFLMEREGGRGRGE